ncbi:GPW/gp25 family protein [Zooshikella marina]|uniref:GPW/gp25 family protein n=1 Tax=Zooshikella ganghwensis TaxID=202772 RepID=UPI001BAF5DED|nr:GPW/gp25 family protein [Zooshikella ganghwensis]MBU2705436.1 GPW/gp25 family protein [Zooshikella ganghwensis]
MINHLESFLGSGWSMPPLFQLQPSSYKTGEQEVALATMSGEAKIAESIYIIINTQPGTFITRPDFGCDLSQYVFEKLNRSTLNAIERTVADSLLYYEPRIIVEDTILSIEDAIIGKLRINIAYQIIQTNSRYNQVFPYYLNESLQPATSL